MKVRRILSLLLTLALTAGPGYPGGSPAAASPAPQDDHPFFPDLARHWSRAYVESLAAQGVFRELGPGQPFRPGEPVTRGEFAAWLVRAVEGAAKVTAAGKHRKAEGREAQDSGSPTPVLPFRDVPREHPLHADLARARELGLARGASDGSFRPSASLSRQEAALFLLRAYEAALSLAASPQVPASPPGTGPVRPSASAPTDLSGFSDADDIAPWAREELAQAVSLGFINGEEVAQPQRGKELLRLKRLSPRKPLTRAEAAALVFRLENKVALDRNRSLRASLPKWQTLLPPPYHPATPLPEKSAPSPTAPDKQSTPSAVLSGQEKGIGNSSKDETAEPDSLPHAGSSPGNPSTPGGPFTPGKPPFFKSGAPAPEEKAPTGEAVPSAREQAPSDGGVRWVEFLPPWDDAEPTATDMSFLLDPPAGKHGRVVVCGEHLCFEDGTRARFWGVNLVNADCCPPKEQAEKIAAHIAKLGFNAVRFHHMSDAWSLGALIDPRLPGYRLAQKLLDRFDYFVAQLEQRGIYIYFSSNVHPPYSLLPETPDHALLRQGDEEHKKMTRLATILEPVLQDMQKRFIEIILRHENPYTGHRYADDPAIAFFEIANENSLLDAWSPYHTSRLDLLPPYYQRRLEELWSDWVQKKYGSIANAMEAWRNTACSQPQVSGFTNFSSNLLVHKSAKATLLPGGEPDSITVLITEPSTESWNVQLKWPELSLTPGCKYQLSFELTADRDRQIHLGLKRKDDGRPAGLWTTVQASSNPTLIKTQFVPTAGSTFSLEINFGDKKGSVTFKKFSLDLLLSRSGTDIYISRPRFENGDEISPQMITDFATFLANLDTTYLLRMKSWIRDLGYHGLVIGSQTESWGGLATQYEVADVIDNHGYWDQPQFPTTKWSTTDWFISNKPMIENIDKSPLPWLAWRRLEGKPYIVSEFNVGQPNEYDIGDLPLLAAVAAWQEWDGVFLFHLDASPGQIKARKNHFYDLNKHPTKLASLPLAARIYLAGADSPADGATALSPKRVPLVWWEKGRESLNQLFTGQRDLLLAFIDRQVGLATNWLQIEHSKSRPKMASSATFNGGTWRNPPVELTSNTAMITTNTAAAITGRLTSEFVQLGPYTLTLKATGSTYGLIGLVSLDRNPLESAQTLLLIVGSSTLWHGATWDPGRTSLQDTWSEASPVLTLPPVTVHLPATFDQVIALDATGRAIKEIKLGDEHSLSVAQEAAAWYLLRR